MARYGLVVDLNICTGCMTCVLACKQENLTRPGIQWNKVLELESPALDQIVYVRQACMHCDNPPCVEACPSKAISRRADGIVLIDQKEVCRFQELHRCLPLRCAAIEPQGRLLSRECHTIRAECGALPHPVGWQGLQVYSLCAPGGHGERAGLRRGVSFQGTHIR
jgi:ferredoxin